MFEKKIEVFGTTSAGADLRRHPRRTVFKSALLCLLAVLPRASELLRRGDRRDER